MATVSTVCLDAIANFRYEPRTKRYRWADGAGKGQYAPKTAIIEQTQRYIVRKSQEMIDLADRVLAGDLQEWQLEDAAGRLLKQIAIAQTFLGVNGYENATDEDWLAAGRFLKEQYYAGRGEDGSRYGLRYLIRDYQQGKISAAQLKYRLGLYAQAGKTAFWEARARYNERQGLTYAVRRLGATDQHCPDCVAYSKMVPQPVTSIVKPGERCQCFTNCKCSLVFMSLEDAVKRGAKA